MASRSHDTIGMTEAQFLSDHFLIAMPGMGDPNFNRTVTYVCEHSGEGAMGLVINRPMNLKLGEIFAQMSLEKPREDVSDQQVLQGGPVHPDRGFVLHDPSDDSWDSTLEVSSDIRVTTSRDILTAMATGEGPSRSVVVLGYAGWSGGQLEDEMVANAWLSVPATTGIIFDIPYDDRWQAAAKLIGIDLNSLSIEAGHA